MIIEKTMELWHRHLRGELEGGLDELLADDVEFYSPIVFSAQKGKEITKLYLNAAGATFSSGGGGSPKPETFYRKEILQGNHAVLEFETQVEGLYVNGIDLITCDDNGKIIEFKVMIRPLKAINLMHRQMAAMLEKLKDA